MPKSGHVIITKIENLHVGTRRKIHWFQKCYSFRFTTEDNEVIGENRFRTVASPGACGRLAVLNWRFCQCMLLVAHLRWLGMQ